MPVGFFFSSFFKESVKEVVARPKVSPFQRWGGGGDLDFLPGQHNSETARGTLPRRGAQRIPAAPSKPVPGPPPPPQPGPAGNAFGEPGPRRSQRAGPRRKRWPRRTGSPQRLRTWERPGPRRPLGAGGDLALGPWRRGRPGLAQRRRLQEARGFGLRRRRVPRPLSRPRSVRETAALRPAPSAAQAPAPAPTSTWGPIETVRHAPPPPPPGAAAAALGRTRGEAPRAGSRSRAHSGLMEEEGGGPPLGSSALRAERAAAGAPAEAAAPQCPPPGSPPLADSPRKPGSPPPARRGRRRVTAAPRGPEAPGAPAAAAPLVHRGLATAAQQAAARAASP